MAKYAVCDEANWPIVRAYLVETRKIEPAIVEKVHEIGSIYANNHRQSFVVALDNDSAGERGWTKAWNETADWNGFNISPDSPKGKDWNDDLIGLVHRLHPPKPQQSSSLRL